MPIFHSGDLTGLPEINLRQIECFISAVENRSITRAAEALFTTQATASRNIKKLEDELGFKLVNRGPRGINTTDAGGILFAEWSKALRLMASGYTQAKRTTSPKNLELHIIDYLDIDKTRYLLPIMEEFEKSNPGVQIKIEALYDFNPHIMESGNFDIAFVQDCDLKRIKGSYRQEIICTYPLVILINKENRLSKRNRLTLEDLDEENLLLGDCITLTGATEDAMSAFSKRGMSPKHIELCNTVLELKMHLLQNKGFTILSEYFSLCQDPKIKTYPIENEYGATYILWDPGKCNSYTEEFVKCAQTKGDGSCVPQYPSL